MLIYIRRSDTFFVATPHSATEDYFDLTEYEEKDPGLKKVGGGVGSCLLLREEISIEKTQMFLYPIKASDYSHYWNMYIYIFTYIDVIL